MSRSIETNRCRSCLGSGCIHCNNKGGVPARVYHRDAVGDRLRQAIFGSAEPVFARANEQRQTLARMRG